MDVQQYLSFRMMICYKNINEGYLLSPREPLSFSSEHSLTWPGHWQATTGITRTLGWIGGIKYAMCRVWNEYLYLLRGKYWICPVTRSRPGGLIWLGSVRLSGLALTPHQSQPLFPRITQTRHGWAQTRLWLRPAVRWQRAAPASSSCSPPPPPCRDTQVTWQGIRDKCLKDL